MRYLLLSGGQVVNSGGTVRADVLVRDGKVEAIGDLAGLPITDVRREDCTGRFLLPGGVDVHTHIDSPMMGTTTADDFASGTRAAACGGTTTVVDFAMQPPGEKGAIAAGADADIVVLDPDGATTISAATQRQRMDYTPYEGWTLPGVLEAVYSRGELIARNGEYVGADGRGRFLRRATL